MTQSDDARQAFHRLDCCGEVEKTSRCSARLHCWLSLQPGPFSTGRELGVCKEDVLFLLICFFLLLLLLYLVWKGWAQGVCVCGSALTRSIKQRMNFQHIPCTFFHGCKLYKNRARLVMKHLTAGYVGPLKTGSRLWLIIGGAVRVFLCFYKDRW